MNPDKYQQAWQTDAAQMRVKIDADLLLEEAQRHQRNFQTVIFWRDFREVGVALLMIPVWLYLGITTSSPWTWYLTVPVLVWIAGFMLVDRMRHKQKPHEPSEPLLQCVKESLTQVEHQIWLLRNIFWWYLLPPSLSIMIFFAHVFWISSSVWWEFLAAFLFSVLFLFVLYGWLYLLNQRAVRVELEPRRQGLLALLRSLRDEATAENADDQVTLSALPFTEDRFQAPCTSPARVIFGIFAFVVIMLLLAVIAKVTLDTDPHSYTGEGYPKRSPFAAVRWQMSQPEVKLGDEWFKLVSLDELPTAEIISFSRRTYGDRWRKRFEEDLVELLSGMKHPPQNTVTLVVQSLASGEKSVRQDIPMTYANRRAIREAVQARKIPNTKHERAKRKAVSIDNTEQFKLRVDDFLELARVNSGFSGVVLVARAGEPIYEGAFGFSHLANRIPNTLDTPFRIASLSKQFTAAAILSLESAGKLSTSDLVHSYLPEFSSEPYDGITIYHLLTHTSGLPRIPEDALGRARWQTMSRAATPVNDYVRLACQCPLKFEPGQGYQYSNLGYRVLSAIIVEITGDDYADFMEERLFKPLGLEQSGVARISHPSVEATVAESVSMVSLNSRTSKPSFLRSDNGRNYGTGYGSGGIYASAKDLLKWDRVLAGENFLSSAQQAKLFRPVRVHYACGWIVKKSELDGRLYQTHSGANEGYFSRMMRIPEDDLVIIALGNVRKTDEIDEALEQLFRLCRALPYNDP